MKDIMTSCLGHDSPGQLIRIYNESWPDSPVFTCCTCVIQNSSLFWYWSWCFQKEQLQYKWAERDKHKDNTTRKVTHYGSHMNIRYSVCHWTSPFWFSHVILLSGHQQLCSPASVLLSSPPIIHMFMLSLRDYTASCSFSFIKDRTGTGIRTFLSNSPRSNICQEKKLEHKVTVTLDKIHTYYQQERSGLYINYHKTHMLFRRKHMHALLFKDMQEL